MRSAFRRAIAVLGVVGLGLTLSAPATAENEVQISGSETMATPLAQPMSAKPVGYVQDPATTVGPSCGLEWFETPPALPTQYDFEMSDGSVQTLPVKVVRQPRDQVVDAASWNALVTGRLTPDQPWGVDAKSTSLNLIVDKPGDPADGFKSASFTIHRHRLLITDQEPVNIAVELGEQPALPAAIDITYTGQKTCQNAETEGTKSSPITWDELTDEQRELLATPGASFTIHGTVNTTVPASDTAITWPRTTTNSTYGYDATATITVGQAKPTPEPTEPEPTAEPTQPADPELPGTNESPEPNDSGVPAKPLPPESGLPDTGVDSWPALASAGLLSLAGAALVLIARRVREA